MCARGGATSHAKGIGLIRDRLSEDRDVEVRSSGVWCAFFAHISPTLLELKPLHCCLMRDHMLCLANVESLHK